jgi:hypothetical protein
MPRYRSPGMDSDLDAVRELSRTFFEKEAQSNIAKFAEQHRVDRDAWNRAGELPPAQLDEWRRRTACFLGVTTFEGGHFYLRSDGCHAVRALLADQRRCQPPTADSRERTGVAWVTTDNDSLPEPNSLQRSHR